MAGWDNPMREFERLRIENAGLRAEVERLRAELAEAWDEGYMRRWVDQALPSRTPNPYRADRERP